MGEVNIICRRCGRKVSEEVFKTRIEIDPEKFYDKYKIKPLRKDAWLCQRCEAEYNDKRGKDHDAIMIEMFADTIPDYEHSVRGRLDQIDILPLLSKIQDRLRLVECTDTCVVDILKFGGKACPYDKPNHDNCDACIREWLRGTDPKFKVR